MLAISWMLPRGDAVVDELLLTDAEVDTPTPTDEEYEQGVGGNSWYCRSGGDACTKKSGGSGG